MDNGRQLKLALDASQPSGSIALQEEGKLVYASSFGVNITHSETLMPQVDHAVKLCGKRPEDITGVLLCNGPGSFTGLRIGLATAKGIAFGLQIPLHVYNSLEVKALGRWDCGKPILSVLDARMGQVYAALYDEHLREIIAPSVCDPKEIKNWRVGEAYMVGNGSHLVDLDGCQKFPPSLEESVNVAASLFALQELRMDKAPYDFDVLASLEPFYLRESTAQIKRSSSRS